MTTSDIAFAPLPFQATPSLAGSLASPSPIPDDQPSVPDTLPSHTVGQYDSLGTWNRMKAAADNVFTKTVDFVEAPFKAAASGISSAASGIGAWTSSTLTKIILVLGLLLIGYVILTKELKQ